MSDDEKGDELEIMRKAKKTALGSNCQAIYVHPEETPNVVKATIIMYNPATQKMERSYMFGCWHESARKWRELVDV